MGRAQRGAPGHARVRARCEVGLGVVDGEHRELHCVRRGSATSRAARRWALQRARHRACRHGYDDGVFRVRLPRLGHRRLHHRALSALVSDRGQRPIRLARGAAGLQRERAREAHRLVQLVSGRGAGGDVRLHGPCRGARARPHIRELRRRSCALFCDRRCDRRGRSLPPEARGRRVAVEPHQSRQVSCNSGPRMRVVHALRRSRRVADGGRLGMGRGATVADEFQAAALLRSFYIG
mmetsp:Transcript_102814/g.297233  ORF Transcript_102814/g.297233 Transcript_102814/m.297233 type:complete len:237 (-) Transcript_102814:167-877(-)